jgi:hypothetical protein
MSRHYSIRTDDYNRWIVSANGRDILICSRIGIAIDSVREASDRLDRKELRTSNVVTRPRSNRLPATF